MSTEKVFFTTQELKARWEKRNIKAVYRILEQYGDILQPIKIGRDIRVPVTAVEQFEAQQRKIHE